MAASAIALGVCLVLASAPQVPPRFIPVSQFTLAWTHSIEKVRWEEDYRVVAGPDGTAELVAGQARIKGSAAGMEPPDEAVLINGWFAYQPNPHPAQPLRLTRSEFTPDFDWCVNNKCVPMSAVMPTDGNVTLLSACQDPKDGDTTK